MVAAIAMFRARTVTVMQRLACYTYCDVERKFTGGYQRRVLLG